MVERPQRRRTGDHERAPNGIEWELFVRESASDPLRHVGSVRAHDVEEAYELGTRLFAWYADDLWICPADSVTRYSTHDLDASATAADIAVEGEPRAHE